MSSEKSNLIVTSLAAAFSLLAALISGASAFAVSRIEIDQQKAQLQAALLSEASRHLTELDYNSSNFFRVCRVLVAISQAELNSYDGVKDDAVVATLVSNVMQQESIPENLSSMCVRDQFDDLSSDQSNYVSNSSENKFIIVSSLSNAHCQQAFPASKTLENALFKGGISAQLAIAQTPNGRFVTYLSPASGSASTVLFSIREIGKTETALPEVRMFEGAWISDGEGWTFLDGPDDCS